MRPLIVIKIMRHLTRRSVIISPSFSFVFPSPCKPFGSQRKKSYNKAKQTIEIIQEMLLTAIEEPLGCVRGLVEGCSLYLEIDGYNMSRGSYLSRKKKEKETKIFSIIRRKNEILALERNSQDSLGLCHHRKTYLFLCSRQKGLSIPDPIRVFRHKGQFSEVQPAFPGAQRPSAAVWPV